MAVPNSYTFVPLEFFLWLRFLFAFLRFLFLFLFLFLSRLRLLLLTGLAGSGLAFLAIERTPAKTPNPKIITPTEITINVRPESLPFDVSLC